MQEGEEWPRELWSCRRSQRMSPRNHGSPDHLCDEGALMGLPKSKKPENIS